MSRTAVRSFPRSINGAWERPGPAWALGPSSFEGGHRAGREQTRPAAWKATQLPAPGERREGSRLSRRPWPSTEAHTIGVTAALGAGTFHAGKSRLREVKRSWNFTPTSYDAVRSRMPPRLPRGRAFAGRASTRQGFAVSSGARPGAWLAPPVPSAWRRARPPRPALAGRARRRLLSPPEGFGKGWAHTDGEVRLSYCFMKD